MDVLLIEDSKSDADLFREAFEQLRIPARLQVVDNGEEALAYLRNVGPRRDVKLPGVILLDWRLPNLTGRDVLAEIKGDRGLSKIPVIVLTSASTKSDIQDCYSLHASCFIVKPVSLEAFFALIKTLAEFWLGYVRLPTYEDYGEPRSASS